MKGKLSQNITEWMKLVISLAVPLAIGLSTTVISLQNRSIAQQQRDLDQSQAIDAQRENAFTTFVDDISRFRQENVADLLMNNDKLLYIRTKILITLRKVDKARKKQILRFLDESSLLSTDGNWLLTGAEFDRIEMEPYECRFFNTYFWGVSFVEAQLKQCIFGNNTFRESNFQHTDMTRTVFRVSTFMDSLLDHANFQGTTIYQISFNGSSLSNVDFRGARFDSVRFSNVNLTGAIFDNPRQLDQYSIRNSILPDGSFSFIDEFHFNTNRCSSLDEWLVKPEGSITIENCSFVSNDSSVRMEYDIDLSSLNYSMVIDSHQAEIDLKFYRNRTLSTLAIEIVFSGAENGVYEINRMGTYHTSMKRSSFNSWHITKSSEIRYERLADKWLREKMTTLHLDRLIITILFFRLFDRHWTCLCLHISYSSIYTTCVC